MDELFNNIFVYIPIILIVLLRILGNRKKQAAGKGNPLEAEEEEAEPVSLPEKPPERVKRPRPNSRTSLPVPEPAITPVSQEKAAPLKGPSRGKPFPENLTYLPALKRAVILAELMAPPKALRGGRGMTGFDPPGGPP
jgi:hypothetical protein